MIKTYPSLKVTESLTICLCLFETIFGQKRFLKYKHNLFSKRYFQSIQMQTPLAKKRLLFYPNISVFTILKSSCKSEIWNVCSCYLATLNRGVIPYYVSNRNKKLLHYITFCFLKVFCCYCNKAIFIDYSAFLWGSIESSLFCYEGNKSQIFYKSLYILQNNLMYIINLKPIYLRYYETRYFIKQAQNITNQNGSKQNLFILLPIYLDETV